MDWGTVCLYNDPDNPNVLQVARLSCLPDLFHNIVNAALVFGGTVALIMIIYGGARMMLSGGDAKQAGAAKQTITYAIIGLLIILLSFTILQFIAYITGVSCIEVFSIMLSDQGRCK